MIKWLPGIVFALAVAFKTVVQAPTPARSLKGMCLLCCWRSLLLSMCRAVPCMHC